MPEFCEATELREYVFMGDKSRLGNFIFYMFKKKMPKGWMDRVKARGFLRYSSPDAVWAMASNDLKALEDLLSDDDYFFGQSHPGTLDCTVFDFYTFASTFHNRSISRRAAQTCSDSWNISNRSTFPIGRLCAKSSPTKQ